MSERIKALQDAGMIFPTPVSQEVKDNVESLSPDEFQSLLSLTRKIGKSHQPPAQSRGISISVGTGFQTSTGEG